MFNPLSTEQFLDFDVLVAPAIILYSKIQVRYSFLPGSFSISYDLHKELNLPLAFTVLKIFAFVLFKDNGKYTYH